MTKYLKNKILKYGRGSFSGNLVKRQVDHLQKYLDAECTKIWEFINPNMEKYLFGMFGDTVVTICYYSKNLNMFVPAR